MLPRLLALNACDPPTALGERIFPPAPAAAVAPKAVADWTRATVADLLTDAERGALAEAFPVPKCITRPAVDMHDSAPVENRQRCRIDLSSANDAELRAVGERMREKLRKTYGGGIGLASSEAPAKPDADGWIAHDGKGMPVPGETIIQARCRWETTADMHAAAPAPAKVYGPMDDQWDLWSWGEAGTHEMEIVAYRVVPQ